MPESTVSTLTAALEVAEGLAALRRSQCDNVAALLLAERDLAYAKARGEQAIIEAAGGEANLGKNEAARERAFTLGLNAYAPYLAACEARGEAEAERRLLEVDGKYAADKLNILLAALNAGILEMRPSLLIDRLANTPADAAIWPGSYPVVFAVELPDDRADTPLAVTAEAVAA